MRPVRTTADLPLRNGQLNFTDSFATTYGQLARGGTRSPRANGPDGTDWYLGFNISRKFY